MLARDYKGPKVVCVAQMYPNSGNPQAGRIYDPEGISPALDTCEGGNRQVKIVAVRGRPEAAVLRKVRTEYGKQIRKQYEAGEITEHRSNIQRAEPRNDGISNTLTTVLKDNYVFESYDRERIRKLTPKEYFRLMGFSDTDFEKAASVNSKTQLYKQAGNSIVVDVLEELFCCILEITKNRIEQANA